MSDEEITYTIGTSLTAGDVLINGALDVHYEYIRPARDLPKLINKIELLPASVIKNCLIEIDNNLYHESNSENLDLALSITEENQKSTIKILKLRGW